MRLWYPPIPHFDCLSSEFPFFIPREVAKPLIQKDSEISAHLISIYLMERET
jgi:hypothetical protein